ncbi:unnamed protein product [Linum trigynum]|uniref:Reverse transcriptase zinc-binding domain-containing protein n=1 Tax=Linum trigynum TaxID=586398 RepID=A0AAV2ENR8_9ROSI
MLTSLCGASLLREGSLKIAYELIQADAVVQPQPEPCWKAIWRTLSPQRTHTFLWLAAHQRLLTNAERSRRHLAPNGTCPICEDGPETTLHVIRDCPYARGVWSHFLAEEPPDDLFFQSNLSSWIRYYITGRSGIIDASLFAVLCWKLWKNRNSKVFEKKLATMEEMIAAVKLYVQQVRWAFDRESAVMGGDRMKHSSFIHWKPPPSGWTCLNTNGSVAIAQASAAAGGCLRDEDGRLIRAFVANLGVAPPLMRS